MLAGMLPRADGLAAHYEQVHARYRSYGNGPLADLARTALGGGTVLDVGCASGGLLALLAPHARATAGLEVSPTAAAEARLVADEVVVGGLGDVPAPAFAAAPFDLVVCADVLEHLPDPAAGLRRVVEWVRPGGAVLVSVPNVAHWSARLRLARGRFGYDPSGIFDEGHLRFFTVDLLRALVAGAGLVEQALVPVVPALHHAVPVLRRRPRVDRAAERLWQRAGRRRPALLGYQLVCLAGRPLTG